MTFNCWVDPLADLTTEIRTIGAPGLDEPFRLMTTPLTTRMVAVAWTVCELLVEGATEAIAAAATRNVMIVPNVEAAKW